MLSIFGTEDTLTKDSEMMFNSIMRLRSFIKHHLVDKSPMERELLPVVEYLWKLFDTIYSVKWDLLIFNKEKNLTIRKCIVLWQSLDIKSNDYTTSKSLKADI